MKLRTLIRIAVIVSIVLLCTGFGVYSFLRMNAVENRQDFNLFTLVPQDATAVLETDRMADLMEDVDGLHCSKDEHFLYVSELFVYLKKYFNTLVGDTPHGLSRQMNKMLISFHEPDTPLNQVLYCSLGEGDYELVESFVRKYCSSTFPSKYFDYNGEEIRIYPTADGRFLAAYFTPDFLAVSFQKRLIEQVIDACRSRQSLMDMASFRAMYAGKRNNVAATVYVRMKEVGMGKNTDGIRPQTHLGSWAEFDMKFNEEAVYCSGISHGADTARTFINALRRQEPIKDFSGERLPASVFFYNQWAISDLEAIFGFTSQQEYAKAAYSDYIKKRDGEWMQFMKTYAGENVMSCLFHSKDTTDLHPCAVMSVAVKNQHRRNVPCRNCCRHSRRKRRSGRGADLSELQAIPACTESTGIYVARNTVLTQLTGITESALHTYACFYKGALLLAPDAQSLSAYVDAVENGDVLDGTSVYEEGVGSLSPYYNFAMMVDMEEMMHQPETYVRLVPNFFFRIRFLPSLHYSHTVYLRGRSGVSESRPAV